MDIAKEFSEIDKGSSNKAVSDLIKYIEKILPDFQKSDEFVDILTKKKNENQHSSAFCVYMTNRCNSAYYFEREKQQKGNRSIDIAVYIRSKVIFTIEAKVLPTPRNGKKRKEYEYVYGKSGGIHRFKEFFHGLDDLDNPLSDNGMIAYIKKDDFEYWLTKINQWVLDVKWDKSEQLAKIYFNQIGRLFSKHLRKDNSEVILHHFWIKV